MVPPRLSVVTLGVRDLPRMRAFYEALGWPSNSDGDEYVRFDIGGAVLALFPLELLAGEADLPFEMEHGRTFNGVTLAVVVASADEVYSSVMQAELAGGRVLARPVDREWGGRSGYFSDPEGNVWEVAWLPGAGFDERGGLIWP